MEELEEHLPGDRSGDVGAMPGVFDEDGNGDFGMVYRSKADKDGVSHFLTMPEGFGGAGLRRHIQSGNAVAKRRAAFFEDALHSADDRQTVLFMQSQLAPL